jgi:sugar-specific transcriptional regulator TrmB
MAKVEQTDCLVALGFTGLEAEAYTFLIGVSCATGYRVAQEIGKAVANTYKALETLERKGAVLVDEGKNRVFRAVPASELLSRLERGYKQRCRDAAETLARIDEPQSDDRLYQLRSCDQVMERCRAMLDRSQSVVVVDAVPSILEELRPHIEEAVARNVEVVVKTYSEVSLSGARVIVRPRGHEIVDALPGAMISINIDGTEQLLALLQRSGDEVHQAIWTSSPIVAYLFYNGLVNEMSQVAVMRELEEETSVDALRRAFESLRHLHPASSRGPAYQNLMQRLEGADLSKAKLEKRE